MVGILETCFQALKYRNWYATMRSLNANVVAHKTLILGSLRKIVTNQPQCLQFFCLHVYLRFREKSTWYEIMKMKNLHDNALGSVQYTCIYTTLGRHYGYVTNVAITLTLCTSNSFNVSHMATSSTEMYTFLHKQIVLHYMSRRNFELCFARVQRLSYM